MTFDEADNDDDDDDDAARFIELACDADVFDNDDPTFSTVSLFPYGVTTGTICMCVDISIRKGHYMHCTLA